SWWQRTLATLRRPPVLALATVVVLIGGAVALTVRGTTMQDEPAPEKLAPPTFSMEAKQEAAEHRAKESKRDEVQAPAATIEPAPPPEIPPASPPVRRPAPPRAPQRE